MSLTAAAAVLALATFGGLTQIEIMTKYDCEIMRANRSLILAELICTYSIVKNYESFQLIKQHQHH
jgi:hypothetical protein